MSGNQLRLYHSYCASLCACKAKGVIARLTTCLRGEFFINSQIRRFVQTYNCHIYSGLSTHGMPRSCCQPTWTWVKVIVVPKTSRRKHTTLTFLETYLLPTFKTVGGPTWLQESQSGLYDRNRSNPQGLHAVSPVDFAVSVGLEDPCMEIKDLIALNLSNLAQNLEPIKISTSFCKTAIQRTNTFVVERRELVFSHRTLPEWRNRDFYKTVPPFGVASDIEKFGLPKLLGIRKSFLKSRKDDSLLLNKGKANAFTFTQALHPRILHRISKGHASVVTNLVLLGELNVFSIHPKINMKS